MLKSKQSTKSTSRYQPTWMQPKHTSKMKCLSIQTRLTAKQQPKPPSLKTVLNVARCELIQQCAKWMTSKTMGSSVSGAKGTVNFRMVRVVKIVDVTKIPAKYLNDEKVLDAIKSAVRTDVLNGTKVDGVEIAEEKQVAAK
jgi:hypothetical protein